MITSPNISENLCHSTSPKKEILKGIFMSVEMNCDKNILIECIKIDCIKMGLPF